MANIIGLQKQEAALKEIQAVIKSIDEANTFMATENSSGVYTISFKKEDGKRQVTEISASADEMNALIAACKNAKREYVQKLASENRIALDPEDKIILGIQE